MSALRVCSRSGCYGEAVATLTYVYADATAVLGPLAAQASPHAADLCERHASSFTAPRGWQVVRLASQFEAPEPSTDDLDALAHAIRVASRHPTPARTSAPGGPREAPPTPLSSPQLRSTRGGAHLRVVMNDAADESTS